MSLLYLLMWLQKCRFLLELPNLESSSCFIPAIQDCILEVRHAAVILVLRLKQNSLSIQTQAELLI